MVSTNDRGARRNVDIGSKRLILGWVAIAVMGASSSHAGTGVGPSREFLKTPYPRVAMLWASVRGDNSVESMAKHDLVMAGTGSLRLRYDGKPQGLADRFTADSLAAAKTRIAEIRALNPDVVIIGDLLFYEYPDDWLPEDHPWWLRRDGQRQQFWPGTHRVDWYNEEYRRHVVRQTASLKEAGVDGVFYDNISNEPQAWVAFLKAVREAVRDRSLNEQVPANPVAPRVRSFLLNSEFRLENTAHMHIL